MPLNAESNPNESTIIGLRVCAPGASDVDFNRSVFEIAFGEDRKHCIAGAAMVRQGNKIDGRKPTILAISAFAFCTSIPCSEFSGNKEIRVAVSGPIARQAAKASDTPTAHDDELLRICSWVTKPDRHSP
jgi:hypothetical protein